MFVLVVVDAAEIFGSHSQAASLLRKLVETEFAEGFAEELAGEFHFAEKFEESEEHLQGAGSAEQLSSARQGSRSARLSSAQLGSRSGSVHLKQTHTKKNRWL